MSSVADGSLSGVSALEEMAAGLLSAKGPQSLLVCSTAGMPVLFVQRGSEIRDLDTLAAWTAELASTTFRTAEQLAQKTPKHVELSFETYKQLLLLDEPFVLLITFPPESGKTLSGAREEKVKRLIEALHEELN